MQGEDDQAAVVKTVEMALPLDDPHERQVGATKAASEQLPLGTPNLDLRTESRTSAGSIGSVGSKIPSSASGMARYSAGSNRSIGRQRARK